MDVVCKAHGLIYTWNMCVCVFVALVCTCWCFDLRVVVNIVCKGGPRSEVSYVFPEVLKSFIVIGLEEKKHLICFVMFYRYSTVSGDYG